MLRSRILNDSRELLFIYSRVRKRSGCTRIPNDSVHAQKARSNKRIETTFKSWFLGLI